ncbi:MAG: hypothetical protein DME24_01120 [Verrucomicrobia bacterium]|nr:MAG: hypothetical protein DME24_01120 [Verrucomicrobiota bacterium]
MKHAFCNMRDQAEVIKAIEGLREENNVLRAQIHAKTGKLPAAPAYGESGDCLKEECALAEANETLRIQLANAKPIISPNASAGTPPTPPQSFAAATVDELCAAVKAGKLTAADAGKLLDSRFKKPTPLTASCIAAKTQK